MKQFTRLPPLLMMTCILIISSCRSKEKPSSIEYVNHDKWISYGDVNRHPLKGQPKEVRSELYGRLSDTTMDATGTLANYELFRFDKEGNMVYLNVGIDTMASMETFTTIDENGKQFKIMTKGPGKDAKPIVRTELKSVREGMGVFRETITRKGEAQQSYSITRFESGGDIVSTETWRNNSMVYKVVEKYSNGRLLSSVQNDPSALLLSYHYYYASNGIMDSCIEKRGGAVSTRKLFTNNEKGDPVLYEEWVDDSLFSRERYTYRYDDKGNWIRKLTRVDEKNRMYNVDGPDAKLPGYSLTVRQITY